MDGEPHQKEEKVPDINFASECVLSYTAIK